MVGHVSPALIGGSSEYSNVPKIPNRNQKVDLESILTAEGLSEEDLEIPEFEGTNPKLLLCPNIPKPMHGVNPRTVLGSKWWSKERKEAYKRTNYHCEACGVHKMRAKYRQWLEGHELYSINYRLGRMIYIRTTPLCHFCHNYIHDGRLEALLDKGKISHGKFAQIIQHGDDVLKRANLKRPNKRDRDRAIVDAILSGNIAEWKDWRMIVNGEEYPPIYVDHNHWRMAHA